MYFTVFVKHRQTLVLHFSSCNHVVHILFVTFVACFAFAILFTNLVSVPQDSTQTTPANTWDEMWACVCGGKVSSVSQQVIFPGTDGSAAAATPWLRMRRGHRSACRSPLLLCWVESPLTPPCLPSYHTEGSGNLVKRDMDAYTQI